LWTYLRQINERGVTVFLTTQYLEEADALAGRLAIIDAGRIAVEGTPQALKDDLGGDAITVTPEDAEDLARTAEVLQRFSDGELVRTTESVVRVFVAEASARLAEVVRALDEASLRTARLEVSAPSLDDVFLRHTGTAMRSEEVRPRSRMPMRSRRR
jgi:ABC-2 type transport system ATP-binding protein